MEDIASMASFIKYPELCMFPTVKLCACAHLNLLMSFCLSLFLHSLPYVLCMSCLSFNVSMFFLINVSVVSSCCMYICVYARFNLKKLSSLLVVYVHKYDTYDYIIEIDRGRYIHVSRRKCQLVMFQNWQGSGSRVCILVYFFDRMSPHD